MSFDIFFKRMILDIQDGGKRQMIKGMNHIALAVRDVDISFAFYRNVLGLAPLCKWDKGAYFLVDDFWFVLNLDSKREPALC